VSKSFPAESQAEIDLKDPRLAAFLAWLVPGLGHAYQGRWAKSGLFFVCILGTFLSGLYFGEGRVVYASWRPEHRRLPYLFQFCVGLPALPAVVQWMRANDDKPPLWNGFMAPPNLARRNADGDELDQIHKRLNRFFELGTVYTMIAGLLNVLVIYDALAGPAIRAIKEDEEQNERAPPGRQSGAPQGRAARTTT